MGLALVAPDCPAGSATGLFAPEGVDGAKVKLGKEVAAAQEILLEAY
jgi:hypothetical protein